jgi:threonine dehydrogenase-like Zn-dependent dehydrogenase
MIKKTLVCTESRNFKSLDGSNLVLEKENAIIRIKRIGIYGTNLHSFEGTQLYFSYPDRRIEGFK